jgi:type I restriction enzyme M protein
MFDLSLDPSVRTSVFEHMKEVGSEVGVLPNTKSYLYDSYPRLLDQVVQTIDKIKMEDRDTKETSMNTYSLKLPQQELTDSLEPQDIL